MLRKIIVEMLLIMLIMSMFVVVLRFHMIEAEPGTRIYLSPSNNLFATINTTVGTRFNVTVRTDSVLDLSAFQVKIYFNDSVINVTRWFEPTWDSEYVFYGKATHPLPTPPAVVYTHIGLNNGSGMLFSMLDPYPPSQSPFSGSGKLCMLEFNITAIPKTDEVFFSPLGINNTSTFLLDSQASEITALKEDGRCRIFFTGPIVYVVYPLDGSLISGNEVEIRADEMNLATNIVNTTFEFTQNEAEPWHTIGVDDNATDGWSIAWNLTGLIEGSVSIRARMINTFGEVGEDISRVIFDLVPPNPLITAPTFPTIVSGVYNLTAATLDNDTVAIKWHYGEEETCWLPCNWIYKNVSKLDASKVGQGGFCGPTAAASCLGYWDAYVDPKSRKRPYDDLYNEKDTDGLANMAREIARLAHAGAGGATSDPDLTDGINEYIKSRGLQTKLVADLRPKPATLEDAIEQFLSCQDVIITLLGAPKWPKGEGHDITLSSLHFFSESLTGLPFPTPETFTGHMDFMDPSGGCTCYGIGDVKSKPNRIMGDWNWDGKVQDDEWANLDGIITVCPKNPSAPIWIPIGVDADGTDGWNIPWDTTQLPDAFYLVQATATDAKGNSGTDLMLAYVNNARVTGITPVKTLVGEGYHADIQVSVENLFVEPVSFNVSLLCNESLIATQEVTLASKNTVALQFLWDTTGVPIGNYIISVNTSVLLNGTTLTRSKYTDSWINVVVAGDVDANGKVGIIDMLMVAKAFGTNPLSPNWNPNMDINSDDRTNIIDVFIVARNFGKSA